MFLLDVILYKLCCLIWPPKPRQRVGNYDSENSANWIILEDMEHQGRIQDNPMPQIEDSGDGPEY